MLFSPSVYEVLWRLPRTNRQVNDRYHPPGIIITENGCADPGNTEYAAWRRNGVEKRPWVEMEDIYS